MATDRRAQVFDVRVSGLSEVQKLNEEFIRGGQVTESTAKRMAEGFGIVRNRVTDLTRDLIAAGGAVATLSTTGAANVETFTNSFRALRLAFSPTWMTASTVGLGLLIESTIRLARERSKIIEQDAFLSARTKQSFDSVAAFGIAGQISGVGRSEFQSTFGGKSPGEVQGLIAQYRELKDPVDRAAFAIENFGERAAEVMPLLSDRLKTNIDRAKELSAVLDTNTRQSLQQVGDDFKEMGDNVRSVGDSFRYAAEWAGVFASKGVAKAYSWLDDKARNSPYGQASQSEYGDLSALNYEQLTALIQGNFIPGTLRGTGFGPGAVGRLQNFGLPSAPTNQQRIEQFLLVNPALRDRVTGISGRLETDSTLEGLRRRLGLAEGRLSGALGTISGVTDPTKPVTPEQRDAYATAAAADSEVRQLKARIESAEKLLDINKAIHDFSIQASGAELDAGDNLIRQRDLLNAQSTTLSQGYQINLAFLQQMNAISEKVRRDFDAWDFGGPQTGKNSVERSRLLRDPLGPLGQFSGIAEQFKHLDADRTITDIGFSSTSASLQGASARRLGLLGFGPDSDVSKIVASYRERLTLAQQLRDVEYTRNATEADADKRRIADAKTLADFQKAQYDAETERILKIAELRQRGVSEFKQSTVAAFQALVAGGRGGFESFVKSFALGQVSTIVGNLAEASYKSIHGKLELPGQTAGLDINGVPKLTGVGQALKGTLFASDLSKGAIDVNSTVTFDNTVATRELSSRLSLLGGGSSSRGGAVSAIPGALSEFGRVFGPGGSSDIYNLPSRQMEYDMNLVPGYPVGNYGGPAAASRFNWGKAAGIGTAAVAGAFGIRQGILAGGAEGALTASGSAIGAASAILQLALPKVMGTLGPVGILAGLGLGAVASFLPNPKEQEARRIDEQIQRNRYTAPDSTTYQLDRYGRSFDYDSRGNVRPIINLTVNALDARSILDRAGDISEAVATHLEARGSTRLPLAIKDAAFSRG